MNNYVLKENNEFPILCETCLGPNSLIRMIKNRNGKVCKICETNFISFRWKPGPKARYKNTIICQKCSKFKNLCQTCLFDLKYNLPSQVVDKINNSINSEIPENNVNLLYKLNNSLSNGSEENTKNEMILSKLAKIAPYYRRNQPKVCTFWMRNLCNRGSECPYLHENVNNNLTTAVPNSFEGKLSVEELAKEACLDKQKEGSFQVERNVNKNIKNRYKGLNDPLAYKILSKLNNETNSGGESGQSQGYALYPSMNPNEAVKRLE